MSRKTKTVGGVLIALVATIVAFVYLSKLKIPVLEPAGPVGRKERNLIIEAVLLSMIVVIPVYVMLVGFAWKYRAGNKKARYRPEMDGSTLLESIWWGIPIIIISILGVVTFKSSHDLDPFKQLSSNKQPLTVQAVALQWRWLFIYPEQGVASMNYVKLPKDRPVEFQITSDAPMNSFWIPQLGGQIYAMSGMATQLHLLADKSGDYLGESANISGAGFADMMFTASVTDSTGFDHWIDSARQAPSSLDLAAYNLLAQPSHDSSVKQFSSAQTGLFNQVIAKYEAPIYFKPGEKS
ncbi:ubiquinol oxidase subunit II [Candidatus Saccharibacteria bacterium]|nr:ubiquinol oxidase subunit II [Candidatus Saccharibacteria bacterium]